jgi:hypothetical protein
MNLPRNFVDLKHNNFGVEGSNRAPPVSGAGDVYLRFSDDFVVAEVKGRVQSGFYLAKVIFSK